MREVERGRRGRSGECKKAARIGSRERDRWARRARRGQKG